MSEDKKPFVIFYNPKTTALVPTEYVKDGNAIMAKREDLEINPLEIKFVFGDREAE